MKTNHDPERAVRRMRTISTRRLTRRHALQGALAAGGLALVGCSTANVGQESGGEMLLAWPAEDRWPEIFAKSSARIQETYRFAVANQDLLQWMPCFCGCGAFGHTSNADCYVQEVRGDGSVLLDSMSFGWGVCIDVTRAVMAQRPEGKSLREIRDYIDATYGDVGPATNTPYPPEGL